ncbi:fungal-specific transcription factor domain-containing protein [Trichoderma chlorosporum]
MSSLACWTCRLRKKKCDRALPICQSCTSLNISCCYSKERPDWMDGGEKQMQMTQVIKAQVKQGTSARLGNKTAVRVFSLHDGQQSGTTPPRSNESEDNSSLARTSSSNSPTSSVHESTPEETDNFLITLYLDAVFPLLFPVYEPATLSGGRSWIQAQLKTNRAILHSALSLSGYYFTLLLAKDANHTLRTPCEQHLWDILGMHMDSAIQVIKQDMDRYHKESGHSDIFAKLKVLGGVTQYLIFATAMPQDADWKIHLSAALTLLDELFQSHGSKNGEYSLETALEAMDKPSIFDGIPLGFHVWSKDQAAFQFYTAFLLYVDTMTSIQLGCPSQFQKHHGSLITGYDGRITPDGQSQRLLEMQSYTGCHGWIIAILGEICKMETSKRSVQHEEEYFMKELGVDTHELMKRLHQGMAEVDATVHSEFLTTQLDTIRVGEQQDKNQAKKVALITKAWLHATMIYLSVVVDGWQPDSPFIRGNVNSILSILEIFSPNLSIHGLMWPICICGFLATQEQQHIFRDLLFSLGPLQALGPARQAIRLMEQVWELRHQVNEEDLGIYNCFQLLGSDVLFI